MWWLFLLLLIPSLTHAGALQLTWTDNSDNEEGFRIYRRETAIPTYGNPLVTVIANSETYTDTSVAPNVNYTYQVTAYNNVGESPPSNEASSIWVLAGVEDMPPIAVSSLEVDPLPTTGLQLHLSFDEGTGTTALDGSGNGYSGQVYGAQWEVNGRVNGALAFDGIDDYVEVDANLLAMDTWPAITIAVWMQHNTGAGAGTNDIVSWWDYPTSYSWVLTHHNNNQYFWEIYEKGNISGGMVDTLWHHVTGVFDGSEMRLYIDGQLVNTLSGLSNSIPLAIAELRIGSQQDGRNWFNGLIDDVRLYDRALTQTEIDQLATQ